MINNKEIETKLCKLDCNTCKHYKINIIDRFDYIYQCELHYVNDFLSSHMEVIFEKIYENDWKQFEEKILKWLETKKEEIKNKV